MAEYELTQTGLQVQTALNKVGTTALTTTATDLSSAINELDGDVDTNTSAIGTLSDLTTMDKDSLVGAINEVTSYLGDADLFKVVTYTASYTISANSGLALTASELNVSTPTGYIPIAITGVGSGNSNVCLRYLNATATGSNNMVGLRSVSSSSISATVTVYILYARLWG